MIKWLCNKIVENAHRYGRRGRDDLMPVVASDSTSIDMENAIRLSVLPAQGGCVVEIRTFDRKNHNWENKAHIIHESEDVAHRVGQLVALEILRR